MILKYESCIFRLSAIYNAPRPLNTPLKIQINLRLFYCILFIHTINMSYIVYYININIHVYIIIKINDKLTLVKKTKHETLRQFKVDPFISKCQLQWKYISKFK